MEAPQITTIIPTFRRPALLRRAIDSVLRQTYRNFQLCIYDNASGDETAEIVAQFARQDCRVKYLCHEANIGACANFNYGLARVDTPYFSFLSDDDILLPEFYETAIAELMRSPDAGFFAGSAIVMTEGGEIKAVPLHFWPREGYFPHPGGVLQLIDNQQLIWTSILFRRAIAELVGPLDLSVGGPADFDYQLRMACRASFVVARKPCAIFLSHADSVSASPTISTFWPSWTNLVANIAGSRDIPLGIRVQAEQGLNRYLQRILFSVGMRRIRAGDLADGRLAAQILRREFGEKIRPLLLNMAAAFCSGGRLPAACFGSAHEFARLVRNRLRGGNAHPEKQYGEYAKWLSRGSRPE